eukprot:3043965-Rhodomonas_salina.1
MVSWKEIWDRRKEDGWGTGMERVKAVKRAMEKLVGVYSFDAARVCDVCRQVRQQPSSRAMAMAKVEGAMEDGLAGEKSCCET